LTAPLYAPSATTGLHTLSLHDALPISPRHHGFTVLELLEQMVERAVADPARRALLARLLGEEAHRLREQPQDRIATREDLDCSRDRKSTRLNSSHDQISYAVFCLKKKT